MARKGNAPQDTNNNQEESAVSDTQEETVEAPAETKTKKDPVPDGYETPVQFAKRLSAKIGSEFRPQMVYGFIKNSKTFPWKQNTDGRYLVQIEEGLTWFDAKEQRKAEREAAKAAKAAEAAAKVEASTEA